ncbi:MAG: CHAT domain-containing protein, partial [Anaerolineae bacterium]|nr:CHAT domain-containing protein [Candidatus Roseilinea sp.]MDW8450640.1 CHAT domain-containing protein [Anaerolineae bacterium]
LAALDEAVANWERILGHPDFPAADPGFRLAAMNDAGGAFLRRYWARGRMADLERALALWQQAVALAPPDAPDRAMYLNNLANGLRARYARTGALPDLEAAVERYRQACQEGLNDSLDIAATAARSWLQWSVERRAWAEAAEAACHLRDAALALVAVQWARAEKVIRLREVQGLAAIGAYAHAQIGQAGGAAEILEAGLARLLGEALERDRRDLTALPPELQERYRRAAERWQALIRPEADGAIPDAQRQVRHADRVAARSELDAAIAAIRKVPGYEDFFRPLPIERICAQARPDRPLAYLATTEHGSAIIVVWPDRAEAILSDFTEAELNALLVETDPDRQNVTGGYLPAQLAISTWLSPALAKLLPALGRLMGPLAEHLRAGGARGVVLIPSGRLGLLPLHAAPSPPAPFPRGEGPGVRAFLDAFEVSYAPSAQALREARANADSRATTPFRLAGVGNPLPNPKPLAYAKPELESIVELIQSKLRQAQLRQAQLELGQLPPDAAKPLYEHEATKPALLAALPGATTAHFSCHGNYALDEPLDSGLQLGDGALALREILDHPAPFASARLAVLSACQTSVTDFNNLPDEAIGLPAGLLQAGVPAVVGTLWSVEDESTALLMVRFYELMLNDGLAPCAALQAAQRWLRDVTNAELGRYLKQHQALNRAHQAVETRMAGALERPIRARALSGSPAERPFADPMHWAAFTFSGAESVCP